MSSQVRRDIPAPPRPKLSELREQFGTIADELDAITDRLDALESNSGNNGAAAPFFSAATAAANIAPGPVYVYYDAGQLRAVQASAAAWATRANAWTPDTKTTGEPIQIATIGLCETLTNCPSGPLWLSSEPPYLSATPPTATNTVAQPLGLGINATTALFHIGQAIQRA